MSSKTLIIQQKHLWFVDDDDDEEEVVVLLFIYTLIDVYLFFIYCLFITLFLVLQ